MQAFGYQEYKDKVMLYRAETDIYHVQSPKK